MWRYPTQINYGITVATMKDNDYKTQAQLAEEMRLICRHLYWATDHAAKVYDIIKPKDKPSIEVDSRQMNLFEEMNDNEKKERSILFQARPQCPQ